MVTGAALATINRLPVLLLPGDIFATRRVDPVLQQLEAGWSRDVSVNDAFRPVSRYWDRINRPEQLGPALLEAMRVLTDPAETGAVTLCLPQDVQAEAFDFPVELVEPRVWHVGRPLPDARAFGRAVSAIREARTPLIVAGGGVHHADATDALRAFAEQTGIPVAETQAGKGALAVRPPALARRDRRDGHERGEPRRARCRPRARHRHALRRLHDGLAHRLPARRRAAREHQRRSARRGQARRHRARRRCPRHARAARLGAAGPARLARRTRARIAALVARLAATRPTGSCSAPTPSSRRRRR